MFSECTSLKYLIISNFNFNNITHNWNSWVSRIFKDLQNLEYIDIYGIKDDNNLLKDEVNALNNKDNLTVCNNSVVITNPNAIYDCCNLIDDILVCNNIQTTIPIIQNTIILIQSIIPQIQTTIPQIQTSIPRFQTTISQIQTFIPKIPQIQTTIPRIQTTSSKIANEGTLLILLGFNSFKLSSSIMSFKVLFTLILNDINSNLMKVHLIINYNEGILEEEEMDCYLKTTNNKIIA